MIAWAVWITQGQHDMQGVALFAGSQSAQSIELQLTAGAPGESKFRQHRRRKELHDWTKQTG